MAKQYHDINSGWKGQGIECNSDPSCKACTGRCTGFLPKLCSLDEYTDIPIYPIGPIGPAKPTNIFTVRAPWGQFVRSLQDTGYHQKPWLGGMSLLNPSHLTEAIRDNQGNLMVLQCSTCFILRK